MLTVKKGYKYPNANGFYGIYGGIFLPSKVRNHLLNISRIYSKLKKSGFINYYKDILKSITNRPSLIYKANNLSRMFINSTIYLKREDLNHTNSHKVNNVIGQILLAKEMGYGNVISETGAGQHGLAVASMCSYFGIKCTIFMGELDVIKQERNASKIKLLGANLIVVKTGTCDLSEAVNTAISFWYKNISSHYYLIGSSVGPHPYPMMVRDFQSVIGLECINFVKSNKISHLVACIGGGSNAIGLFYEFIIRGININMTAAEACGTSSKNSVLSNGKVGILHGCRTYSLIGKEGYLLKKDTIASGLNYPGIGPEHSLLFDKGIVNYSHISNSDAKKSFFLLIEKEGIVPSYESSHAISQALKIASIKPTKILVSLSGIGDKDL
ncbi:tryptophan synthase subunit beta [Candidatus Vidania fulgoroideae]|uniref:tryptophan synthase n=1 Tax=Candidatus Vidania fulgoroideorum TaxID=881286 RepID=A0A974XE96_9PROT|nr:tryptophan synthase subunit beta [Candidatus Vidania fulgoroideae]